MASPFSSGGGRIKIEEMGVLSSSHTHTLVIEEAGGPSSSHTQALVITLAAFLFPKIKGLTMHIVAPSVLLEGLDKVCSMKIMTG